MTKRGGLVGKESACNAGDPALIPGLGRSPGKGNGSPLQYSGLENSMDWFPCGSAGKESTCNAGDPALIPGLGKSAGEGNGSPLRYLAWKIPWSAEPARLPSVGSQKVGHD